MPAIREVVKVEQSADQAYRAKDRLGRPRIRISQRITLSCGHTVVRTYNIDVGGLPDRIAPRRRCMLCPTTADGQANG